MTGHMCGAVNSESGTATEIIVAGGYGESSPGPVYIFSIEENAWRIGETHFKITMYKYVPVDRQFQGAICLTALLMLQAYRLETHSSS